MLRWICDVVYTRTGKRVANSNVREVTLRTEIFPGDLGGLVGLHGRIYAEEYGWDATFEAYVAQALSELVLAPDAEPHRLWIVEQDGSLVGSIGIIGREERAAQLRCFLVRPDARGHGIGRRLLDEALTFCRKQGFASVYLWTTKDLVAAARLYESAGFTLTTELTHVMWGATVTEQRYDLSVEQDGEENLGTGAAISRSVSLKHCQHPLRAIRRPRGDDPPIDFVQRLRRSHG